VARAKPVKACPWDILTTLHHWQTFGFASGTQNLLYGNEAKPDSWIPAFAGMTILAELHFV
jgi:hypothetical protein